MLLDYRLMITSACLTCIALDSANGAGVLRCLPPRQALPAEFRLLIRQLAGAWQTWVRWAEMQLLLRTNR